MYNGCMRGSIYTKRDRQRAETLYICSGLTLAKVARFTQISAKTLRRWSQAEGWDARRATYRRTALTLPERMQAQALKMEQWADEEKEQAQTVKEIRAAMRSASTALYALSVADRSYRAHINMYHLDEAAIALFFLRDMLTWYRAKDRELAKSIAAYLPEYAAHLKSQTRLGATPDRQDDG